MRRTCLQGTGYPHQRVEFTLMGPRVRISGKLLAFFTQLLTANSYLGNKKVTLHREK